MSTDISITHAEIKPVTSSEVKKMRARLDAVTSVSDVEGIPAAENLVRSLELLRGPANSLAKREDTDSAHAVAIAVRDHLKDARLYLRHLRQRAGISPSTGKRKAPAPTFKPSTPAEWEAAKARRTHNLAVALRGAEAGAVFLALNGKVPLTSAFPQVDSSMTVDVRGAAVAKAKAKGHDPHSIGSTSSARTLKSWQAVNGELAFGISPGLVGALVVDCDDVDGAAFTAFLAQNEETLDLSRVPVTVSGRGGRHYWFANPDGIGCGKLSTLCVDLKGVGGQVVAPGMMIAPKVDAAGKAVGPARHYQALPGSLDLWTALRDKALPPVPACLAKLIAERGTKSSSSTVDKEARVQAALDALFAGPAADKPNRDVEALAETLRTEDPAFGDLWDNGDPNDDHSTGRWNVAGAMVRRYTSHGFDVFDNAELMALWEHAGVYRDLDVAKEWAKNIPDYNAKPTDAEGFGKVDLDAVAREEAEAEAAKEAEVSEDRFADVRSALATADLLGLTFAEFDALANPKPEVKSKAKTGKLKFESRQDIRLRSREPVRFLVDGLIEVETLFALTGDYETGKSLMALDMAHCIAYGLPWAGRKTTRAGVIYLCPEGPGGLARRQDAWHLRQAALGNEVEDGPIEVVRSAVDLFGGDDHLKEIAERVMTFKDRHGIECELVIVDTFRQATPGADENSAKDVSAFTAKLNKMRDARKVACGYVHHQGKDAAKGASGSTALIANVDVHLVAVLKTKGGKEGELRVGKLRDGENRSPIPYKIVGHDAGMNTAGEMERAGVVIMSERADFGVADVEVKAPAAAAAAPQANPTEPLSKEPFGAEDPRAAMVLEIVGEMAPTGGKVAKRDLLDPLNARLRRLKQDRMEATKLKGMLAELVEEGRLCRIGTGPSTGYALPEQAGAPS